MALEEPNVDWTALVAERKIKDAMDAGEFDNLPGRGQPLDLDTNPFETVEQRVAHRVLRNAGALPEWMQYEKDIERERLAVMAHRERGLRAVRFSRNGASRERAAARLREEQKERMDLVNTLVLKYTFVTPTTLQRPFTTFNLKRELAALEVHIADACGSRRS
jgi:hypothetical protein